MMRPLTIGVAAAALIAGSALSAQGHGHGGGHGNGHQAAGSMMGAMQGHGGGMRAAGSMQGHGNGHGGGMRAAASMQEHGKGHGGGMRASAAMNEHGKGHGNAMRANTAMRAEGHGKGNGPAERPDDVRGKGRGNADHGQGKAMAERGRQQGPDGKPEKAGGPDRDNRFEARNGDNEREGVRVLADGRRFYSTPDARPRFDFGAGPRGLINGCPPGLAKKDNGCRPPGLVRQAAWQPEWWGMRNLSGRYYYDNGYLVRLNGDSIAGYLPLLGGALSVGNPWPSYYEPMPVPDYYANYYGLGPANGYRYFDNALYRVDPSTSEITAIAALLTGDNFTIGQPLPVGYDVYNVPYPYRSQYVDGPDAWYRYSDGYVYQVDPTTRLVRAAIELLTS